MGGDSDFPNDVLVAESLADAWKQLALLDSLGQVFVIEGSRVYQEAIQQKYVHTIVMTSVETPEETEFDTFFPDIMNDDDDEWKLQETSEPQEENGLAYKFQTFVPPNWVWPKNCSGSSMAVPMPIY